MKSLFLGWSALVSSLLAGCILRSAQPGAASNTSSPPNAPASVAPTSVAAFSWADGARAAVSLTYDDAIASQIDNALPSLQRHGLRATFFLSGASPYLQQNRATYRNLASDGFELASHTMNHPCDKAQSWVQPGFGLQDYDSARMQGELEESLQQLRGLGQNAPFTFAYPCGSTWLGEAHESYVPLIFASFLAARTVAGRVFDPAHDQLVVVPSVMGNQSASDLTTWVGRAITSGGWLIFTFHGVAGDYLPVTAEAHEALLDYLVKNKSKVWTERFGTVAAYAKAHGAK